MYVINARAHYDAAHFLRGHGGMCERLHGHRFEVEAAFAFEQLGDGGMAVDFVEAESALRGVTDGFEHRNLNELPAFAELETTAENQARYIFEALREARPALGEHLLYVRVWETPTQWAQYSERPLFF